MPVFAPAAILTAVFIDSTLVTQSTSKTGKIFTLIFGIVVIIVGLALAPMYFYFKKLYPLDVPENLLLSVLFFSIVIVAFSLMAIKYFQRADFKRYWVTSSISVIMILLFMLIFAAPIVDRHKSFAPFCRQVSALVPAVESIYTYEPDETIKGVISFYTGRYVTEINEVTDELFRKETPCFIVIRDKEKEIEKKLLSANKLFPLVRQEMGTGRALVLFSNKETQKTLIIRNFFRKSGPERQEDGKYTSFIGNAGDGD